MAINYPITVNNIEFEDFSALSEPMIFGKIGDFVSVRPCDKIYEGKTFLGVYLGEAAISQNAKYNKETGTMKIGVGMRNPAILVPSLNKIIYGMESWWGVIRSPEQLKAITDEQIDNVWYVQALKAIQGKAAQVKAGEDNEDE